VLAYASLSFGAGTGARAIDLPDLLHAGERLPHHGRPRCGLGCPDGPNNQERKVASNTSEPSDAERPPSEGGEARVVVDRTPTSGVTREQMRAAVKVIEAEVNKVQARYKPAEP
jgi:hypothetical protein